MPKLLANYAQRQEAVLALNRIRSVWKQKRIADDHDPQRQIRLGLERVQHAVEDNQSWLGVHVGGTNGKGSICAFLAGLFKMHGVSFGTFTSPALPESHNSVSIDNRYITKDIYEKALQAAERTFARNSARWRFQPTTLKPDQTVPQADGLTPFERETAAAFGIFNKMKVQYGIVEVGMGGKTDATNIMQQKAITVISKIGLDHQEYLGKTLRKITSKKAGIMRKNVPCVVDHTNEPVVLEELRRKALAAKTRLIMSSDAAPALETIDTDKYHLEEYQKENLLCAVTAFQTMFPHLKIDLNKLLASDPFPSGRTEPVSIEGLTQGARKEPIVIDGGHNKLGMETVARYVDSKLRKGVEPVTWVVGISQSPHKSFAELLDTIVRPQDNVAIVEYTPQENNPPPAPARTGRDYLRDILASEEQLYDGDVDITSALQWATDRSASGPIVVTGSLYLIRHLYNLPGVKPSREKATITGYPVPSVPGTPGGRPLYVEDDSGADPPLSAYAAEQQKIAETHRDQVSEVSYRLKVVKRKLEAAKTGTATSANAVDESTSELLQESEQLLVLQTKHRAAYVRSISRAREGMAIPKQDAMTDAELLEWWMESRKALAKKSPFLRYTDDGLPVTHRQGKKSRTARVSAGGPVSAQGDAGNYYGVASRDANETATTTYDEEKSRRSN